MQREKWSAMTKPAQWCLMAIYNVVRCLRIFTIRPYHCSSWILATNTGVMQPMLRSPDFGTGFYMFYGDNLKNKWILNHNSLSFYDRFYSVRTDWVCNRQRTDASGSVEATQNPSQPERSNTDCTPKNVPDNKSEDGEVICVSMQQQENHGLKRRLSEIESTSEDIQEIPSGEKVSSKKHKKVKKHKHKHDEGSKKKCGSSTETPTPDVICLGESVVDEAVKNASRNKSRKHKKRKHKQKHKRQVTRSPPETTEVICLDDTAESIDIAKITADFTNPHQELEKDHLQVNEEGYLTETFVPEISVTPSTTQVEEIELECKSVEKSEDNEPRSDEQSNRKEKKKILTKDIVNYLDGKNSEAIEIPDDNIGEIVSEKKTTRRQRKREREKQKKKLSRDIIDAVYEREFDAVNFEQRSDTHQKANTETPDCIPEQQFRADAVKLAATDVESDMDVASSPSVGGIHYASELEQTWQYDSNEVVLPSFSNVHYVGDLEKQWQEGHYVGDLEKQWQEGSACANAEQSSNFQFVSPWKTVFPPWSAWKPSKASSGEIVDQRQQSDLPPWQRNRSTSHLQGRSFHTSSDNWRRNDKQPSPKSPQENSAEFTVDMTKPYSGSDSKYSSK